MADLIRYQFSVSGCDSDGSETYAWAGLVSKETNKIIFEAYSDYDIRDADAEVEDYLKKNPSAEYRWFDRHSHRDISALKTAGVQRVYDRLCYGGREAVDVY